LPLFKIQNDTVAKINTKSLDLEKKLQALFEKNLETILNIHFLAHEYVTSHGGRIDTLGIDNDGSPVIIEYKKNQNDNVINQGLSYLRWLLDHKADFQILAQSKQPNRKIDWDSPRVICIAESFSKFDLDTIAILPIKIELFKYRLYDMDILYLEPETIQKISIATSRIYQVASKSKQYKLHQQSSQEVVLQKAYTLEAHTEGKPEKYKELFYKIREYVLSLDEEIKEEPKKYYIAYKLATNIVDIEICHSYVKVSLNLKSGQLNDPLKLAKDLTQPVRVSHWGNGDYEVKMIDDTSLEEVFKLIRQSYELGK
jgi:predicted transport protein